MAFGRLYVFQVLLDFMLLGQRDKLWWREEDWKQTTNLVESHAVLDEQADAGVEETDVALEDKVALRLSRDPRLEFPQAFLCYRIVLFIFPATQILSTYLVQARPRPLHLAQRPC